MTKWQPMKDAPKDGSSILIYEKGYYQPDIVYWHEGNYWISEAGKEYKPSGWMNLPLTPDEETK